MSKTHTEPDRVPAPSTPLWVKVFVGIAIALVLLFIIMHLTGNGFGPQMHRSTIVYGVQPL